MSNHDTAKELAAFANECCLRTDGYEEEHYVKIKKALDIAEKKGRSELIVKITCPCGALRSELCWQCEDAGRK